MLITLAKKDLPDARPKKWKLFREKTDLVLANKSNQDIYTPQLMGTFPGSDSTHAKDKYEVKR
jgi:hypothetical protein